MTVGFRPRDLPATATGARSLPRRQGRGPGRMAAVLAIRGWVSSGAKLGCRAGTRP